MKRFRLAFIFLLFVGLPVAAQDFAQGFIPLENYDSHPVDSVSMGGGNLLVHIPIVSYPQRGSLPSLGWSLRYQNVVWASSCSYDDWGTATSCSIYPAYWAAQPALTGTLLGNGVIASVDYGLVGTGSAYYGGVTDASGAGHATHAIASGASGFPKESMDSTGIRQDASGSTYLATDRNGITSVTIQPCGSCNYVLGEVYDPNGNTIAASYDSYGHLTGLSDSISRSIPPFPERTSDGSVYADFPAFNSSTARYTAHYSTHNLQSNVGCSVCYDYSGTTLMLDSVDLPNGTSWSFGYDNYGDLTSITLPTGGQISYAWDLESSYEWLIENSYTFARRITTRTLNPDPSNSSLAKTWTYGVTGAGCSISGVYTGCAKLTDPDGNYEIHLFETYVGDANATYYDSSSNVLKTVDSTYFETSIDRVPKTVTTTWPSGKVNKVCYIYDNNTNTSCTGTDAHDPYGLTFYTPYGTFARVNGNLLYKYEYDYGSGSPGSLLRKTATTYNWQGSSTYLNANLLAIPSAVHVYDGSSTLGGETTYTYDESSYSSCSSACGLLTTQNSYSDGSTYVTTHTHYTGYGMPSSTVDGNSNATAITYGSSGMFPSEIQLPTTGSYSHIEYPTYDYNTGLLSSYEDQNSNTTSYDYDSMRRLTSINYPDGGSESYSYTDSATPNPYFDYTKAITSSSNFVERGTVDGLGRPTQNRTTVPTTTCSGGYSYVLTSYDSEGRKAFVSNPDCSSSTTTGTSYQYDALNRVTKVIPADGSTSSNNIVISYSGGCATVTDPASKTRTSCTDGLGRMTGVWEDPSSLNYETDYTYDTLDNLTQVIQNSSRTRTFTYDFLSRLHTSANPESGTTCYGTYSGATCQWNGYDANGNLIYRTDARSITTTYGYDALNRITSKSYSDSITPPATFTYDVASLRGVTIYNPIGRLVTADTYLDSSHFSYIMRGYDSMGRVSTQWQWFPVRAAQTYYAASTNAWYNLAGLPVTYTNNSAVNWFYVAYDSTGSPTGVTTYPYDSNHPQTLASSITYSSAGQVTNLTYGNGVLETNVYNSRLQPCRMNANTSSTSLTSCTASAPSGNVEDLTYGFNLSSSNNGNVASWSATGTRAFTRTYSYDNLNRLSTMTATSDPTGCTGLSWSYDAWGNRTAQTTTGGTCNSWSASYSISNRITNSGFSYDASGNLTSDGTHSYFYDAENRLLQVDGTLGTCSTATMCYQYDAEGHRVQKTNGSTSIAYVYDITSGNVIEETNGSDTLQKGYIYLGGQMLAEYNNGTTYYAHNDHLGSTRIMTGVSTSVQECDDYLPFGESFSCGSYAITTHKFTGYDRDSETGNDNALARYYASRFGSFLSPDALGGSPDNPQTLNRYTYVGNSPLNNVDPSGMFGRCPPGSSPSVTNPDHTTSCGSTTVDLTEEPQMPNGSCANLVACLGDLGSQPEPLPPAPVLKHIGTDCTAPQLSAQKLPGGHTVNENIQNAKNAISWGQSADKYLYDQFHTNGPQDYKNQVAKDQKEQYVDAGNFNFGAVCTAVGHSLAYCQSAAGLAAILGGVAAMAQGSTSPYGGIGTPFAYPPFGDQPRDFKQIGKGSSYAADACRGVNGN